MAVEVSLARKIVLTGFLIASGPLGVSFALAVGLGSAKAVQRGREALLKEPGKPA